jgi:hypothetical protein
MMANLNVFMIYSIYPFLAMIAFISSVLGTHNYITIPIAVAAIQAMNLMKASARWMPFFLGLLVEFLVSMKRIQDFML